MYREKCIGRIDKTVLKNVIRHAYKNYKNHHYDLKLAKCLILDFVIKTHITTRWYSTNPDDYKLNICNLYGLKLNLKTLDDFTYHICVKSGKVYVS